MRSAAPTPVLGLTSLLLALLAAPAARAASGRVAGPDGKPVVRARACLMVAGTEGLCTETDASGWYRLPDSEVPGVRIRAAGFLPRTVAAVDQEAVIVLERSAAVLVKLVDEATGEPVGEGKVTFTNPSGRKVGPFPANRAGVRVSTMVPGRFVPVAAAPGYAEASGAEVDLVAGEETEIVLRLRRL
jgi:hypothetical protein